MSQGTDPGNRQRWPTLDVIIGEAASGSRVVESSSATSTSLTVLCVPFAKRIADNGNKR